jgi:hypothetical protein
MQPPGRLQRNDAWNRNVRQLPSYNAHITEVTSDTANMLHERWFGYNREQQAQTIVQTPKSRGRYRSNANFVLDAGKRKDLYDAQPPEYWERLDKDRETLSGVDHDVADNVRQYIRETLLWTHADDARTSERPDKQWIAFVELVEEESNDDVDLMYAMVLSINAPFKLLEVNYMSIFFQGIQHGYKYPGSYQRGPNLVKTVFKEAIQYVRDRVVENAKEARNAQGSMWHGARVKYVAITLASDGSTGVVGKLGLADELKNAEEYKDTIGPTEESDYFDFPPMWYRLCERCSEPAQWTWEGHRHLDVAFCGIQCSDEHALEVL